MGKLKDIEDGVTNVVEAAIADVKTIAERIVNSPVEAEVRDKIATAIRECGIPLNEAAIAAVVDKIVAATETDFEHVKRLAEHVLGYGD